MRPTERHEEIVRLVNKSGEITVEELAQVLDVSRETVRRDLGNLDTTGRIRKFHGGARVRAQSQAVSEAEGPFAIRLADNTARKRKIAYTAAALLEPGDSLFIDTGTTTLMLAEALVDLPALTIITNSCRIAATVAANPDHKVFLIGGAYSADAGQSLGHLAIEQIQQFRARHAFLTVGALDKTCVMDFDIQETEVARAMIERVESVTVLADCSKAGKLGVFEVATWSQIDRLVTDEPLNAKLSDTIRSFGVNLIDA